MTTKSSLRLFLPRPYARARLFCFPHAGGSASSFHELAKALPEAVELTAVQYPGRQDRYTEPMPGSITELADGLASEMESPFDRPTAFFGHSMGAIVAFEVARRLQPRFPSPLAALFVSACRAPGQRSPSGMSFDEDEVRDYLRDLGGSGARALAADEELWQLAYPVLSGDLRLIEQYRYTAGAPLACPLSAIGGDQDASVTSADLERWQEHVIGGADLHAVPGDHFYFDESPLPLISILTGALDQCRPGRRVAP